MEGREWGEERGREGRHLLYCVADSPAPRISESLTHSSWPTHSLRPTYLCTISALAPATRDLALGAPLLYSTRPPVEIFRVARTRTTPRDKVERVCCVRAATEDQKWVAVDGALIYRHVDPHPPSRPSLAATPSVVRATEPVGGFLDQARRGRPRSHPELTNHAARSARQRPNH